jgi:hypothetical protein
VVQKGKVILSFDGRKKEDNWFMLRYRSVFLTDRSKGGLCARAVMSLHRQAGDILTSM